MYNNPEDLANYIQTQSKRMRDRRIDQAVMFRGLDFNFALELYQSDLTYEEVDALLDSDNVAEVNKLATKLLNGKG